MSTTIILSYALIIVGIIPWALLIPGRRHVSPRFMNAINIFGGAFLFASCFINLVPHMFLTDDPYRFVTPNLHFKIAAAVMVGFLIQLLLERLTHGAEHGHDHVHEDDHPAKKGGQHAILALLIGLCIHAFLEGMPLVETSGAVNQGLVWGIVIHNIPVALILVTLFTAHRMGFWRVLALLMLFGIMSPAGSLVNLFLVQPDEEQQRMIIGLVIGVLLHVSSSILFDHKQHGFSWLNLGLCVVAFAAAFLTVH